jgi:hypothetical protein
MVYSQRAGKKPLIEEGREGIVESRLARRRMCAPGAWRVPGPGIAVYAIGEERLPLFREPVRPLILPEPRPHAADIRGITWQG